MRRILRGADRGAAALLQQPREAAVLEHAPAGLLLRAVAHDVVLVVHGLDRRAAARARLPPAAGGAAARARLALVAMALERHRELVGDGQRDDALVVLDGAVQALDARLAQRVGLLVAEVVRALERREPRGPQDLVDPRAPDAGDDVLVAQDAVQRPRALRGQQFAQRWRVGPRLRPEGRKRVVVGDVRRAQDLDPRALARAEFAQAQLVAVRQADEQPRSAIAQRGALVEELQAPGRHEVHQQGEVAREVDDEVLAHAPHAGDGGALDRVQRRVEGLQRVDARRERRLDDDTPQRGIQPACGDLDLGQLGHTLMLVARLVRAAGLRARARWSRPRAGRTARPPRPAADAAPLRAAAARGRRARWSSRRRRRPR